MKRGRGPDGRDTADAHVKLPTPFHQPGISRRCLASAKSLARTRALTPRVLLTT